MGWSARSTRYICDAVYVEESSLVTRRPRIPIGKEMLSKKVVSVVTVTVMVMTSTSHGMWPASTLPCAQVQQI